MKKAIFIVSIILICGLASAQFAGIMGAHVVESPQ
jgi:hypothetical protein